MDAARAYTDQELAKMERHLSSIYRQSEKDIKKNWDVFMKSHKDKLDDAHKELKNAERSGDRSRINAAKANYERIARNVTFNNNRYKVMLDDTTTRLAHVNETAVDYLNGNMAKIYTANYNEFGNTPISGYSFTQVNEQAIKNIALADKTFLPQKQINIPKDKRWNAKNINSQLMQGILQGESITKIAKRLGNVTDMNKNSAIRNARTMTTAAENKGRQDSFKKAENDGVILEKEWVAAHDDRTRAWHYDLDGQRRPVDKPFENDFGEIMFPGDSKADPANVYNCRCSMRAHVKGFKWNQKEAKEEIAEPINDTEPIKDETYSALDPEENLQSSIGDAYEYHRISNNLNATTRDDLGDDFFKVNLAKMDNDTQEAFVNQFESLSSKYDTTIQQIRPMDKMEWLAHKDSFASTFHNYEVDASTIMYNPAKINDVDRVKELVKNGYATQIKEEFADRYVATHEFAHTLIDMGSELNKSRNWVGADYDKIKSIRKEINGVFDKYVNEIGALEKAQKSAELDALTTLNNDSWKKASKLSEELKSKSLGKYSLANSDEFMAECFTHSELGGAQNNYVDEIMNIINTNFRRK